MTGKKPQRGPLLPSIVMVMLATAATGLLALVGLQALPDSVVPSTFGGDDPEARTVDVSESPNPVTTKPPAKPSATSTAAPSPEKTKRVPNPVRTATTVATTEPAPAPTKNSSTPKKTSSPSPTASKPPSPTATTQAPSPAPSCGTARKPRCPKAAETTPPAFTTGSYSHSSNDAGEAPTYSTTKAKHDKKAKPAKRSGKARKR